MQSQWELTHAREVDAVGATGGPVGRLHVAPVDGSLDACVLTDRRGTIQRANSATETLLEMREARMIGKLLVSFVARRGIRLFRKELEELNAPRPGVAAFEVDFRPRGGKPFTVRVDAHRVASSSNELLSLAWTLRPVIDRAPRAIRP
jgi:PAS domain S-box-containing protein